MIPIIKHIEASTFVGKRMEMSIANNKTGQLWGSFMPHRRLISNVLGSEFYSIECYPTGYFNAFQPQLPFEKWAVVKVEEADVVPEGMEVLHLEAGAYAVFTYKGLAQNVGSFYEKIFTLWLPTAGYSIDERPHFAVMGERYKNNDPDSEETIWIPIKESSKNR